MKKVHAPAMDALPTRSPHTNDPLRESCSTVACHYIVLHTANPTAQQTEVAPSSSMLKRTCFILYILRGRKES
eukprot:scaffold5565_cov92-Cylindrotheca_fusiformis.AAC.3